MMKTLIQAITHMDELPRHRFATFKLFYTDITPPDYEPPNFQPGDEQKDKWYFMTHNLEEVPDRFSVGNLDCGYHSCVPLCHLMRDRLISLLGSISR